MLFALYTSTVFTGAFLLFQVQPLIARALLPSFGGSPSTWTACLLFFQSTLFFGYLYAHLIARLSRVALQAALHLVLLLTALALLGVLPDPAEKLAGGGRPLFEILALLLNHLGLPCLLLSASTPLFQLWYGFAGGRRVYSLYAFSNAGSLLALVSYPVAFEPLLDLGQQAGLWSVGFGAFCLAAAAAASVAALRAGRARPEAVSPEPVKEPTPSSSGRDGTNESPAGAPTWFFLSAIPSAMLLAVTNHISLDVAAVPLLWVAPLTLFLFAFVLCFGWSLFRAGRLLLALWLAATVLLAFDLFSQGEVALVRQVTLPLAALFIACMLCCGELARLRPDRRLLTVYYLAIAGGGAAGGLFVGLVAPRVFTGYFELQLSMIGTYLILLFVLSREPRTRANRGRMRWLWLGLGLGAPLLAASIWFSLREQSGAGRVLYRHRSFYGVLRVTAFPGFRLLTHGRIAHGMQFSDRERRRAPTACFGPGSGVGRALLAGRAGEGRRIGVLGLGVGVLAGYGRVGDSIRYYEIDPAVPEVARKYFTYLRDSAAKMEIVLGDGRLTLEREPPRAFDLLVLDAFSSDAVPAHLITAEAFAVYLRHLEPDGIIAANATNRHLDLDRVMAGSARFHRLAHQVIETGEDTARGLIGSRWVLMARQRHLLESMLKKRPPQVPPQVPLLAPVLWTDAHGNLLQIVRSNFF